MYFVAFNNVPFSVLISSINRKSLSLLLATRSSEYSICVLEVEGTLRN
jgi:hypothetical protein